MRTFLMSPPGPAWGEGGRQTRALRGPLEHAAAVAAWTRLRDTLVAHGGRVVELPPPDAEPPPSGLLYTAQLGARLGDTWLAARMAAAQREAEPEIAVGVVERLGLRAERIPVRWEGQADVCALPGARYVLTYGARSEAASIEEVRRYLPHGARVLAARLADPFLHGETCLASLSTPKGHVLLAYEGALADREDIEALRQLARPDAEVVPIGRADALAGATQGLLLGSGLLMPAGVSASLLEILAARGLRIETLDLAALFGRSSGGPRGVTNDLGDL